MSMRDSRPWNEWEDYPAGLFSTAPYLPSVVLSSHRLLSDPDRFETAARAMFSAWPVTTHAHLSDPSRSRKAWVGQATCCHAHGATGAATREAWAMMTDRARDAANAAARKVIREWETGELEMWA